MTLYTTMPLELVLGGIQAEPGPFFEVTYQGVSLQLQPVGPGIGRIVRLLYAPLDCYLQPEYAPGQLICYQPSGSLPIQTGQADYGM
ncbi:hypothetical protein D7Z26_10050 [Cohnella endophytica]|uniref:YlzJ-like protein n=1 Tax=Cohnella endophytica TaxID=2419778 RepID=A0A494Y5C2_9BACL|nr:YlzJ-like family protein [Cohnella endophytica]RKP55516.1 hypothetical protein D7Z26_10050 [Cohnella endophytica]